MATPLASWSQVRGFKAIYPPRPVLRLYPSTATQDGPHLVEDDEYEDIGSAVNVPVESNNWPSTVSAAGMLYMNWLHVIISAAIAFYFSSLRTHYSALLFLAHFYFY